MLSNKTITLPTNKISEPLIKRLKEYAFKRNLLFVNIEYKGTVFKIHTSIPEKETLSFIKESTKPKKLVLLEDSSTLKSELKEISILSGIDYYILIDGVPTKC